MDANFKFNLKLKKYCQSHYFKMICIQIPRIGDVIPFLFLIGILIILIAIYLPINGYILVIVGLSLDIIGAIFVISPIVNQYSKYRYLRSLEGIGSGGWVKTSRETDMIIQDQNKGRLGLVILVLGFLIQIIGNYFQFINN